MSDEEHLPPPVTGLVAGKYELVRLIGRGGMGSVWEGRHASLGTRVAIKFIEAEYADSNEARARFDNEARAAATIQSKHAIQIFDHGVTDTGRPYIVMEMLVGEPLDRRIERQGTIALQETARILQQVCRALGRAHDSGIVHRDLKPENIFLVRTPDEDDEIAKVLDFGIAKIQPPPGQQGVSSSTKTGAVLGTPYYMSPEQARGLRNVDHRTDLWSLGVIAYKCVIGVLPFEGESVGDLLVKICTSPLPVPSHALPGLPTTFDAWFARALDREPERRFQSAAELSDGLAFASGLSVRRGPTSSQPQYVGPASIPHASRAMSGASPGMTAAPFVSSTPRPGGSSRGLVLASVFAALVGVTVGAVTIVKLSNKPTTHVTTPHAASPAAPSATPSASASTSATASASTTPPPTATAGATGKAPPRPLPSATTAATAKPAQTTAATTAPPATTTAAAPPKPPPLPPTPKPNADPGY